MLMLGTAQALGTIVSQTSAPKNLGTTSTDWWPEFQHDPANTGYSTSTAPSTAYVSWNYTTRNGGFSNPIVADYKVFIGSIKEKEIICLDSRNGNLLWVYTKLSGPVYEYASPIYAANKVYVATDSPNGANEIVCLDAQNGSLVWKVACGPIEASLVFADGKIYACEWSHTHCFDANTGVKLWEATYPGNIRSTPGLADNRLYIASDAGTIYCLNASDGHSLWNFTTNGEPMDAPTIVDGKVFFASGTSTAGAVYCLDAVAGTLIWKNDGRAFNMVILSSPAVAYGKVYIGVKGEGNAFLRGGIFCLNEATGTMMWRHRFSAIFDHGTFTSPAVADGKIFIEAQHLLYDRMLCLDANTGKTVWSFGQFGTNLYFSSPAIANGHVYFGAQLSRLKGMVFCIGASSDSS